MHFYKVTAVRKFFFFLDARRRGRIAIKEVLCSPILQELLDLRRPDLSADDLRSNWFSQESAAQRCSPYISPYLPYISLHLPYISATSRRRARRRCTTTTLRWMRTRTACSAPNPNPNPNPKP